MPQSINRIQILGHIGGDLELKATQTGIAVLNFNVATTESYKDQNGQWQNKTEWHNCQAWEYIASKIAEDYQKGSKIFLEGKVRTNNYEKDGVKKSYSFIQVKDVYAIAKKNSIESESNNHYGVQNQPKSMQDQWDEQHKSNELGDDDDVPF
jgi:single-strand DNA-binding protein